MPRFEPFPGIRYDERHDLAVVTAPPYDVLDEADRAALAAQSPVNVVHVDLPRGGDDPYADAGRTFRAWLDRGDLVQDDPSLYLYRMTASGASTLGVIGALGLEPPGEGDVLPHEQTTPKAKSDRLDLLRATEANLSPVWGLSLSTGLSTLLDPSSATALGAWADPDGIRHELWRVDDPGTIDAIVKRVGEEPVVIADGHHRYETCLQFGRERPELAGASSTLCYVVELVEGQLTVEPIHRLLRGVSVEALERALGTEYDVDVDDGAGRALVTVEGVRPLRRRDDTDTIDSVVLDRALAQLEGVDVTFQHGSENVERLVRQGEAVAGVLLRPVSVGQITSYARTRRKMPPKSTFFWPKPRTGTVFRSLR